MFQFNFGAKLAQLRKQKGLSQAILSDGIMSREYLSQIENGHRMPNSQDVLQLFERLGYTPDQFMSQITDIDEHDAIILRDTFRNAQAFYDEETMNRLLEKMENNKIFEKGIFLQFKLRCKATICWRFGKDAGAAQEILFEAIRITIPDFDEELADTFLYGHCDIEIIILIADIYFECGKRRKSVKLLENVAKSIRKYYVTPHNRARALCFIQYYLCTNLGIMGKYKKSLKICNEAIDMAKKERIFEMLPSLNYCKACALFYLGNREEAKDIFFQVYGCYLIFGRNSEVLQLENFASKELKFDLSQKCLEMWV